MAPHQISDTLVIPVPPAVVWDILIDTARHAEIDGSGTVRGAKGDGVVLRGIGDTFGMRMRLGLPYPIRNVVVEYEPQRRIAWRHVGRHRWRYELAAVPEGTAVTETFDYARALGRPVFGPLGVLDAHRRAIPATLARLHDVAVAEHARDAL